MTDLPARLREIAAPADVIGDRIALALSTDRHKLVRAAPEGVACICGQYDDSDHGIEAAELWRGHLIAAARAAADDLLRLAEPPLDAKVLALAMEKWAHDKRSPVPTHAIPFPIQTVDSEFVAAEYARLRARADGAEGETA